MLLPAGNLCVANAQVEVLVQFFVGMYDHQQEYVDDWRRIGLAYFMSASGFWFDSVTSIPWSFMDLHFYMVRTWFLLSFLQTDT